jgi:two-component system CheB/CheR fusion protein
MGLHNLKSLQQYVDRLSKDPKETTALYRDLLISVTAFFRDPEAYQALRNELEIEALNRDSARFPFRVWVPGCATGEEAYSLAILLIECLEQRPSGDFHQADSSKLLQVFASDVDEDAIAMARAGIYPLSIANDVDQNRLNRFFSQTDSSHFQIGKQLRESIVFSRQNLINDAPFSKLDMISCRNLLIYLEPEMQRKVISLFHFALSDHGVLMLGPSESISQSDQLFEPVSKKWRIFRKRNSNRRHRMPIPLASIRGSNSLNQMQLPSLPPRQGHKEMVEKALISFYAPATVLVNREYEILYMTGPLVDYLEFPVGEPNHNLLEMCRPGLRGKLRFACQKSIEEDADTDVETQMKRNGNTVECSIHVRRIKSRLEAERLFLISFDDKGKGDAHSSPLSVPANGANAKSSTYSDQLERDLKWNNEELSGVIEELEGANEELKTSNEEVMSMNEELQSANEELETSKEELQSLNEELSTVNAELLEKVTDLDVANNDILNLLASTDIATLFLDNELLIQRFTPPTVQLLNVRATDVGRPLSDITTRFIDNHFLNDCQNVIRDAAAIQSTVEGENSRMYLRRILPYRSQGDQVVGVVVTFVDLTERLLLEKTLKQSKDHLEAILDSAVDAILTIDEQGIVSRINPATETLFGQPREKILGQSVVSLLTLTDCEQPTLVPSIQSLPMPKFGTGNYLELKAKRKDRKDFDAELTVSRIDHSSLFIVVIRDVSQRMDLQKRILEIASDEQRRIGQELHDGTQQELTGLTLIAGTIEEFFIDKSKLHEGDEDVYAIDKNELSRLTRTASKLVQGLNEANRHVQSLSHGIMPVQIDVKGLHSALTELAHETTVEGKVDCNFVQSGIIAIDSNAVATHLYRIAQEAINNAQRHGAAKTISVSLTGDAHQLLLEIIDDGCGIDASLSTLREKPNHGTGLQIMEYRASVIGGNLSILPGKDKGTTLRCTIPK